MGRPAYGVRGMNLAERDYIVGMAVTPKERNSRSRATKRVRRIAPTRVAN